MKARYVISTLFALALSACNYSVDKMPASNGGAPGGMAGPRPEAPSVPNTPGLDPRLSYANVYASALSQSCKPCHTVGSRGGVNVASYEKTFAAREEIASAVESGAMPIGLTMPDDQRALLLEWLRAGAPRDGVPASTAAAAAAAAAAGQFLEEGEAL